jgi:phytol kinase
MNTELRNAGLLSMAVMALLAIAVWWRQHGAKAEWTRKLFHFGGGLVCLSFPFLLRSPWTVLMMALGLSALFACGKQWRFLACLHDVDRPTRGSEYYPLAVWMVFVLSAGELWRYVCALLVLGVADAGAALIGSRYGTLRYEVETEQKSLEGSLMFLLISFLAIHLPLLLMTDLPRATCVLSALLVAMLVTGFEAVSLHGTDNLFVPVGVCVLLGKITTKPVAEITYQDASLFTMCVGIGLLAWRARSLNVGGTIVIILAAYGAWSLGSEWWALPILSAFAVYMVSWLWLPSSDRTGLLKVRMVFRAVVVPLLLVIIANSFGTGAVLYRPYVTSMSTVLTFALWTHVMRFHPKSGRQRWALTFASSIVATAVAGLPVWWALGPAPVVTLCAILVTVAIVAVAHNLFVGAKPSLEGDALWSSCRLLLTVTAALIMLVLQRVISL